MNLAIVCRIRLEVYSQRTHHQLIKAGQKEGKTKMNRVVQLAQLCNLPNKLNNLNINGKLQRDILYL